MTSNISRLERPTAPRPRDAVVEGKFGSALNAGWTGATSAKALPAYKAFPLTVEFWCRIAPRPLYYNFFWTANVLVANEPWESADHWAIYLTGFDPEPGAHAHGALCVRLPGMDPEIVRSSRVIADGEWHHVAMVLETDRVALFVDGEGVASEPIVRKPSGTVIPGPLTVGHAVLASGGTLDFNGQIDDLRLSSVARKIAGAPNGPLTPDAETVGLWSFDDAGDAEEFADASGHANPLRLPTESSLDEIDFRHYQAGPSPLDTEADAVALTPGAAEVPVVAAPLSLDGQWELVAGDEPNWVEAMAARVPGSVHTALHEAGVIPPPYHGRNQDVAAAWSAKTFWYRKVFPRPPRAQGDVLVFHGICNRCTIWLNGQELGRHEGMFTRVEFPVDHLLEDTNTLVVKLDPAIALEKTVSFMNAYDYGAKVPPLGIWRSTELRGRPAVEIRNPFVATRDAHGGVVDLVTELVGPESGWAGTLVGTISPETFAGTELHFKHAVASSSSASEVHLRFTVPDPHLWWPVDLGEQHLYRLELAFLPEDAGAPDLEQTTFGIRTIEMAPVNGKPRPRLYDWTFVVNGKPMFVKGANWCTPDALMDLSRARYERALSQAACQHIQMLRCWGYGLVETDEFYDLCDRKGILVMQEWPTDALSFLTQPYDLLEETVRENTLRLRNHPSLALYCAGNESSMYAMVAQGALFAPVINMMGRLNSELDGTRVFHRAEPRGGSDHDYSVFHVGQPIDDAFTAESIFNGEFGYPSYPSLESVERFLPEEEKTLWPPPADGSFAYHTPNDLESLEYFTKTLEQFTRRRTMRDLILDSQLTQAVVVRHTVERARSRWPESTGTLYFLFNDNAPAAGLATVDWYGTPKISYYLIQQSYAPLLAVTLFSRATTHGEPLELPVLLLDDADELNGISWNVAVRAYGADLSIIDEAGFSGEGSVGPVARLGELALSAEQTETAPLLTVTDVVCDGRLASRNWYFTNFQPTPGCLFALPQTNLSFTMGDGHVTIKNEGTIPAVGVNIACPSHPDSFFAHENYVWLEPDESKTIAVASSTEELVVTAWNAPSTASEV